VNEEFYHSSSTRYGLHAAMTCYAVISQSGSQQQLLACGGGGSSQQAEPAVADRRGIGFGCKMP
jgi:hypothetical protein